MDPTTFDLHDIDIQWCPGCGDFKIMESLKKALAALDLGPEKVVIVSGIGQAAKTPHFMKCNFFNGLHGRALSNATAIKVSNPSLNVIALGGDGDMYGEGGNHFIHTIRRNPDITNLVFNNMVYGLTKGQASPTSPMGFKTPVQVEGVINEPFNPVGIAVAQGASFVARAFAGDVERTKELIMAAIQHKGYALVDIFQPCVSFNKVNTYQWFREHTYYLGEEHDPSDRKKALYLSISEGKYPLGIIYRSLERKTFEENQPFYKDGYEPFYRRSVDLDKLRNVIDQYR
ncbi:MAG: 2-oxoacid ferredoxin oxidoreductase [Synergistales bacterium]|nr:2-oxoacid ferredoxin oxidoreductase [Synergistales bacterium]